MLLDINSPLGQRVVARQGRIESGQIANMRLLLMRTEVAHVRLVGEDRTLCGRSLYHAGQWAWHFIHRGQVGQRLPEMYSRPCRRCLANPAVAATAAVENERRLHIR